MIICSCAAVGHAAIVEAVEQDGVRTVKQLQVKLNVANQCQKCAVSAHVIIKLVLAAMTANKNAGFRAHVQLNIHDMLEAIAAAEKTKLFSNRLTKRLRVAQDPNLRRTHLHMREDLPMRSSELTEKGRRLHGLDF